MLCSLPIWGDAPQTQTQFSSPSSLHKPQGRSPGPLALLPAGLTCDVGTHNCQRGQVGGAEGREPARVHLGHSVAPKQLILEEQADLQGTAEAVVQPWGAPVPSSSPLPSAEHPLQMAQTLQMAAPAGHLPTLPPAPQGPGESWAGGRSCEGPATPPFPPAHCPHPCFPGSPCELSPRVQRETLPHSGGVPAALLQSSGGGGSSSAPIFQPLSSCSPGEGRGHSGRETVGTVLRGRHPRGWVPTSQHGLPCNVRASRKVSPMPPREGGMPNRKRQLGNYARHSLLL